MATWLVVPISGTAYNVTADFMQVDANSVKFFNGTSVLSGLLARTISRSTVEYVQEVNATETRIWGAW